MADLPDLSHRRTQADARGFWRCECGTLQLGAPNSQLICPKRVAEWVAEQRDAAATNAVAAVVAWLRCPVPPDETDGVLVVHPTAETMPYSEVMHRLRHRWADAIEAGNYLEVTRG